MDGLKRLASTRFTVFRGDHVSRFIEVIIIQNVDSVAENKDGSDGVETNGDGENLSDEGHLSKSE